MLQIVNYLIFRGTYRGHACVQPLAHRQDDRGGAQGYVRSRHFRQEKRVLLAVENRTKKAFMSIKLLNLVVEHLATVIMSLNKFTSGRKKRSIYYLCRKL